MHGENGHELLTDLYQLTMAQGYWETGQGATQACFHAYFRDYPFRGGYAAAERLAGGGEPPPDPYPCRRESSAFATTSPRRFAAVKADEFWQEIERRQRHG